MFSPVAQVMFCSLLQEHQNNMSASEDDLLKLREVLESEMSKLKSDSTTLANLRGEHSRLKVRLGAVA